MKAFGIGCFHFGITSKMQSPFSPQHYVDEIERVLKQITNISEIDVYFDAEESTSPIFEYHEEIPEFRSTVYSFPDLSYLELSFNVYLPRRVQSELLETEEEFVNTQSERFQVVMRNCFHSPATFIVPLDAQTEECEASTSVVLMRRYLEKEIEKMDAKIKLEFTGPSPFHANLFLKLEPESIVIDFDCSIDSRRGYDKVVFVGGAKRFPYRGQVYI